MSTTRRKSTSPTKARAEERQRQLVPFDPRDIGGELISLLSEGLYKNPLDALREYIQNSIDAKAKRVFIRFAGRSIFVTDNGHGMTRDVLINARRFAVSDKSIHANVGFRGIGIYAAFHLCDRMRIRTKPEGHEEHIADFDFARMRLALDQGRMSNQHDATGLAQLLTEYVEFRSEETGFEDSRTIVELHNVSELYLSDLSSVTAVEDYLLRTVPIDFEEDFPYRSEINIRLSDALNGRYNPITIILQYSGKRDKTIRRSMPTGLAPPRFEEAKDDSGRPQALIWGCRNSEPKSIQPERMAGFVYKMRGFTVGGRSELRETFKPRTQLYPWFTGEVHVLNDRVLPNAARDAFEYNPARYALDMSVEAAMQVYLEDALRFQAVTRAKSVVDSIASEVAELQQRAESGLLGPEEHYALIRFEKEVARQASAVKRYERESPEAQDVRSEALRQRQLLKELIRSAKERQPRDETDLSKPVKVRSARPKDRNVGVTPELTLGKAARIRDLFTDLDLSDAQQAKYALSTLLSSIDEILDPTSVAYQDLFETIQAKLVDENLI
jgi:hypothetical protein